VTALGFLVAHLAVLLLCSSSSLAGNLPTLATSAPDHEVSGPFDRGAHLPASIRAYIGTTGGRDLRLAVMGDPKLAPAAENAYKSFLAGEMWDVVAAQINLSSVELFDRVFAGPTYLVTDLTKAERNAIKLRRQGKTPPKFGQPMFNQGRGGGSPWGRQPKSDKSDEPPGDAMGWVMITTVDQELFTLIVDGLNLRLTRWIGQIAVYESNDRSSIIAYHDNMLMFADSISDSLLREIIELDDSSPSLSDHPGYQTVASQLGNGEVGAFFQDEMMATRWWGIGIDLVPERQEVRARTLSNRVRPDTTEPLEPLDLTLPRQLGGEAMFVATGRIDYATPLAVPTIGQMVMGMTFHRPQFQKRIGPTEVIVYDSIPLQSDESDNGDSENRDRTETLMPVVGWAVEVRSDFEQTSRGFDYLVSRAIRGLRFMVQEPINIEVPKSWPNSATELRRLDISDATERWEGLPGASEMELVWATVISDGRAWWVCTTQEYLFHRIASCLRNSDPSDRQQNGRQLMGNGEVATQHIGRMLQAWPGVLGGSSDETGTQKADAISGLLNVIDHISWVVEESEDGQTIQANYLLKW
jgi:hypothetical protein